MDDNGDYCRRSRRRHRGGAQGRRRRDHARELPGRRHRLLRPGRQHQEFAPDVRDLHRLPPRGGPAAQADGRGRSGQGPSSWAATASSRTRSWPRPAAPRTPTGMLRHVRRRSPRQQPGYEEFTAEVQGRSTGKDPGPYAREQLRRVRSCSWRPSRRPARSIPRRSSRRCSRSSTRASPALRLRDKGEIAMQGRHPSAVKTHYRQVRRQDVGRCRVGSSCTQPAGRATACRTQGRGGGIIRPRASCGAASGAAVRCTVPGMNRTSPRGGYVGASLSCWT